MWHDAEQLIKSQLAPGETALWTGHPGPGWHFALLICQ